MAEVFGINPGDASAVGLLALVVLLVLTGRLVPRRTHEDVLADRERWRQAYLESEAARKVEHEHTSELLEMARLGGRILTALPQAGPAEGVDDARLDSASPPRV